MSSSTSEGINLSVVFAPIYWGFIVSVLLGGISILQGYLYFPGSKDRLSVQLVAAAMLIFDILSLSLVAQSVYYYLIPHFGSTLPLNSITVELSIDCLLSAIITFISQMYFVKQLFAVPKPADRWWSQPSVVVTCLIAFFAVCAFAFGIACAWVMIVHKHSVLANKAPAFKLFFGLAKAFGALTDILATVAMCVFLSAARTGMRNTNSMITSLIHFVVNRGILVTLIQVLLLIFFFAVEDRLYWFAFHVNVTKLYVNTFFAMLNGRTLLHQKQGDSSLYGSNPSQYRNKLIHLGESMSNSFQNSQTEYQVEGNLLSSPLTPGTKAFSSPKQFYRPQSESLQLQMPTVTHSVIVAER